MLFRRMCGAIEVLAFIVCEPDARFFELRAPLIDNTAAALGAHLTIGSSHFFGTGHGFYGTVLACFLACGFCVFCREHVYYTFHLERGIPRRFQR